VSRVVQLGADVHQRVQTLLPWYVGAGLDEDERASIEAHLAECPRCQAELAWERKLQAADDGAVAPADADLGFAVLRERIAGHTVRARTNGLAARLASGWQRGPAWMRWALVGQGAVIATFGVALLIASSSSEDNYRALGASGAAPGAAGNLIVRFRPDATEQQMRSVLRDNEARLVYGPTTTDAYLLAVPPERVKAAVTRLRAQNVVLLVESLDGSAPP